MNAIDGSLIDEKDDALSTGRSGRAFPGCCEGRYPTFGTVMPRGQDPAICFCRTSAALKTARSIAENNAFGLWQTKIGLNIALDAPSLRHAIEIENRTQMLTGFTNNPSEAAKAHMEKRAPLWDPM